MIDVRSRVVDRGRNHGGLGSRALGEAQDGPLFGVFYEKQ